MTEWDTSNREGGKEDKIGHLCLWQATLFVEDHSASSASIECIMDVNTPTKMSENPQNSTIMPTTNDNAEGALSPFPTKQSDEFRQMNEATSQTRVVEHYRDMRRFQTVDFYKKMGEKYSFDDGRYRRLMTIDEALAELEHYVVGRPKVDALVFFRVSVLPLFLHLFAITFCDSIRDSCLICDMGGVI